MQTIYFSNEAQLQAWATKLMQVILQTKRSKGVVIYLNGALGVGKTCFSRAMIKSLGFQGSVKSPTYTLVEEYNLPDIFIYHFDLYRLSSPEELDFIGIRDYFASDNLCLIEWANQGEGFLPTPDLILDLQYVDDARSLTPQAKTELGSTILNKMR